MKKLLSLLAAAALMAAVPMNSFADGTDPAYQIGDVNHDGLLDALDASMILRANADALGASEDGVPVFSDEVMAEFELYDVDGNGCIDGVDASFVLAYNAGTIDKMPR
jgi:hypothetical protein